MVTNQMQAVTYISRLVISPQNSLLEPHQPVLSDGIDQLRGTMNMHKLEDASLQAAVSYPRFLPLPLPRVVRTSYVDNIF